MKTHRLLSMICAVAMAAESLHMAAESFPGQLDGTMMPYNFSPSADDIPWDASLHPVFVNYLARHGARFLSSATKTAKLKRTLTEERNRDNLSPKGELFLTLLNKVDSVTGNRWGALNDLGKLEEATLGKELAETCPELFKKGKVKAVATYVPRVVMSMYEVCHSLAQASNSIEVYTSEGPQYNPLLRYFKTNPDYVAYLDHGEWKDTYDKFAYETLPTAPAASMLLHEHDTGRLQKLSLEAYEVLQALEAMQLEADPEEWFTLSDYRKCWEVTNLDHYYKRSVSEFSDLPARCAIPLLRDLTASADSAFNATDTVAPVAQLRFGHAETVFPLFALMRLPECYAPDCKPHEVAHRWKDWEVAPLGANLMMVCLKDDAGKEYVALRLNGRWIETEGKKVVEWPTLRTLWESYMEIPKQ